MATDRYPIEQAIVAEFRFAHGPHWTEAQAAAWWGVSERTWRRYERGETCPPAPLLKAIQRYRLRHRRRGVTHSAP